MSAGHAGASFAAVGSKMMTVTLDELDILEIGNTIQIGGAIWTGNGKVYLIPLPDESMVGEVVTLRMDPAEFERFLNQSDVQDVRGPGKAILRKSQRQIDQWISWEVFKRDGYRCRYCWREGPLTIDHIILWEQGGATVAENLVSACRRCNKTRGNMEYEEWLDSVEYRDLSESIPAEVREANNSRRYVLSELKAIKQKGRSR